MTISSGKDIAGLLEKLISEKHQVGSYTVDLTVSKICRVKDAGCVDFGGSEEEAFRLEEICPSKKTPKDNYGWWSLSQGTYMVQFNEKIEVPEGHLFILQPLSRTLKAGGVHPTSLYPGGEAIDSALLTVGEAGFNVKENARISSLMGFDFRK